MASRKPKPAPEIPSKPKDIARWEGEGGAVAAVLAQAPAHELGEDEERVLRCLGIAVLRKWSDLPMPIQRDLFNSAVEMGEPRDIDSLKTEIARFLHRHKEPG